MTGSIAIMTKDSVLALISPENFKIFWVKQISFHSLLQIPRPRLWNFLKFRFSFIHPNRGSTIILRLA